MKILLILLISTLLGASAVLSFDAPVQDFGEVPEGKIVNLKYRFTNTGDSPLIINKVTTDCGCTASSFPQKPIAPGMSDHISVQFSTRGKEGVQEKRVSIVSNASEDEVILKFTGTVIPH
jgi:hypothetical protein